MEPITSTEPTCYRHPDRRAGVRCQRCERSICPNCMTTASVGFHCPECAKGGRQRVYDRTNIHRAPGKRPIVTQVLVAINVVIFVLGPLVDGLGGMFDRFAGYNPLLDGSILFTNEGGLIASSFQRLGEVYTGVADGAWYRIVTAGFLHAGIIHLGFNMFALWRIGPILEPALGRARFVAAYVASLVAGSLGVLLLSPGELTVGASGAIFGLFGLLFLAARARGIDPWASGIGMTIGINLLLTFSIPGISIGGHVGGLVGGLLCGWFLFEIAPKQRLAVNVQVGALAALAVALAVAAVVVA